MDEFKTAVKRYVELEKRMKDISEELKNLRNQKTSLNDIIIDYMSKHKLENCNVDDSVLQLKVSSQLETLNKDYIQGKLEQYYTQHSTESSASQMAENATKFLISNRESNEKKVLKLRQKK